MTTSDTTTDEASSSPLPAFLLALGVGLYAGMRDWRLRPGAVPEKGAAASRPNHYRLGYAVGTITQGLIVAGAALAAHGLNV